MRTLTLTLLAGAGLTGGCTDHRDLDADGTQSIEVELVSPANPGAIDARLPVAERTVVVNLRAKDAANELDESFTKDVQVYAQYLGTLTPSLGDQPLATLRLKNGVAMNQTITLPPSVFGATTVWFDDGDGVGPDYVYGKVSGASPALWYPDPFIRDLQTPRSETGLDALSSSPLQDKQVMVIASRHGARGRLVIQSVFAQGYTVSDVLCADEAGTPPCTADKYDHAMIYTFSAGRGSDGHLLQEGEAITGFAGGLSEFNGLTEIGFPRTITPPFEDKNGDGVNDAVVPAREPQPVVLQMSWFNGLSDPEGRINFERNEAGPIEIRGGFVCPLDADYTTYKQWKLDPSGEGGAKCSGDNVINVITSGVVAAFDPATFVGRRLPRVVGVLRPVNIGSFNVWIIYPRGASDLTLP